jgi:putative DNA primase/helicase
MSDFMSFATAHGLQIDKLYPADRVQRCATTDKPRSRNGAWFWDGVRGWVSDWAQGGELHWFDGDKREFTPEEKRAWAIRKGAVQKRQEDSWKNAALAASIILRDCELKQHNYMHFKGLKDVLVLVNQANELIVPMRNAHTNDVQGIQIIKWVEADRNYDKKMLPGMRAKGAVLRLGPRNAQETIFCEGYATGLSLEIAARQMRLSAAVMVCFSDSNMAFVAESFKGRAYCYADNDVSGAGERAAVKAGLRYCMSDVLGNDANDDHKKFGLMAVCKKLMQVRQS